MPETIASTMIFVSLLGFVVIVGAYVLAYAGHCLLVVVQATAAGADEVTWPDEPIIDWLQRSMFLAILLVIWLFPAFTLSRALNEIWLPRAGTLRFLLLAMPGVWLIFPIGLLSTLSAQSPWVVFRPLILWQMVRLIPSTFGFYLSTAGVMAVASALWYAALFGGIVALVPVAAVVGAGLVLIYARLLGRMAWLIQRLPLPASRSRPAALPKEAAKKYKRRLQPDPDDPRNQPEPEPETTGRDPWGHAYERVEGYGTSSQAETEAEEGLARDPWGREVEREEGYEASPEPLPPPPSEPPLDGHPAIGYDESEEREDARETESEVPRKKKRKLRPTPRLPEPAVPLFTGVYEFPCYTSIRKAMLWLSFGGTVLGFAVERLVAFYPG